MKCGSLNGPSDTDDPWELWAGKRIGGARAGRKIHNGNGLTRVNINGMNLRREEDIGTSRQHEVITSRGS
jgi:hypothetical protein